MGAEAGLVDVETVEGGICRITLTRPQRHNAMNVALRTTLTAALEAASGDPDARVLLVCGEGSSFSAGSDLKEAATLTPIERARSWERLWAALDACGKPVIAAVEGRAFGAGFEFALACDMIVAGAAARFALPEVKYGFVPGGGGTQRLTRLIGKQQAMRIILAAEEIDCAAAEAMGLISLRTAKGKALTHAMELAKRIAGMPQNASLRARMLISKGPDMPLPEALRWERAVLAEIDGKEEQWKGAASFVRRGTHEAN